MGSVINTDSVIEEIVALRSDYKTTNMMIHRQFDGRWDVTFSFAEHEWNAYANGGMFAADGDSMFDALVALRDRVKASAVE